MEARLTLKMHVASAVQPVILQNVKGVTGTAFEEVPRHQELSKMWRPHTASMQRAALGQLPGGGLTHLQVQACRLHGHQQQPPPAAGLLPRAHPFGMLRCCHSAMSQSACLCYSSAEATLRGPQAQSRMACFAAFVAGLGAEQWLDWAVGWSDCQSC